MSVNLTPEAASEKYVQDMAKAVSLTPEQKMMLCDLGYYNEVIHGYLILAMQDSGFDREEIERALSGLNGAFDDTSAAEAKEAYRKF